MAVEEELNEEKEGARRLIGMTVPGWH